MEINSQNNIQRKSRFERPQRGGPRKRPFMNELSEDVFQKTTVENPKMPDAKRLQFIYDKTYRIFLEQNPITGDLNMKQPEIVMLPETLLSKKDAPVKYNKLSNTIEFSADFSSDWYACYSKNYGAPVPFSFADKKNSYEKYKASPYVQTIKLTEKEKEFYVSSLFARELRHCLQNHLVMSTGGCQGDAVKIRTNSRHLRESLARVQKTAEEGKIEGVDLKGAAEIAEYCKKTISNCDYVINYKPKNRLDYDTKIKYSMDPDDFKFISVKDKFTSSKNQNDVRGCLTPDDVDAFNYQSEFIKTRIPKKTTAGLWKNILNQMAGVSRARVDKKSEEKTVCYVTETKD